MWHIMDGAPCKWCSVNYDPTKPQQDSHTEDCDYWDRLEELMEADRDVFERNPDATHVHRVMSPYDFPVICYTDDLHVCNDMVVEVRLIGPGMRRRTVVQDCTCDLTGKSILTV